jgi:hypothetical protein
LGAQRQADRVQRPLSYGAPLTKPVNLRTIRPDGTGLRFVTHFHGVRHFVANGSYSPNARWILFRTDRGGAHFKLWKVHPDGSDTTLVGKFRFLPGARDWGAPSAVDPRDELAHGEAAFGRLLP